MENRGSWFSGKRDAEPGVEPAIEQEDALVSDLQVFRLGALRVKRWAKRA